MANPKNNNKKMEKTIVVTREDSSKPRKEKYEDKVKINASFDKVIKVLVKKK